MCELLVASILAVPKWYRGPKGDTFRIFQTHNTLDRHCYDSNGKPLVAAAGKPSESKRPYKKFGGNKSMAFMQTMFETYVKAKKAGKSEKHKKRDYDSSSSSNNK
jgi:hypothetical protein